MFAGKIQPTNTVRVLALPPAKFPVQVTSVTARVACSHRSSHPSALAPAWRREVREPCPRLGGVGEVEPLDACKALVDRQRECRVEAHGAPGRRRPAHVAERIELLLPPCVPQVGEHLAVEVEVVPVDERMPPVGRTTRVEVGASGERPVPVEVMVEVEALRVAFPGRDHRVVDRGALDAHPCGDVGVPCAQGLPVDAAGLRRIPPRPRSRCRRRPRAGSSIR